MSALLSSRIFAQSMKPPSAALVISPLMRLPMEGCRSVEIALVEHSEAPLEQLSQQSWVVVDHSLVYSCIASVPQS